MTKFDILRNTFLIEIIFQTLHICIMYNSDQTKEKKKDNNNNAFFYIHIHIILYPKALMVQPFIGFYFKSKL